MNCPDAETLGDVSMLLNESSANIMAHIFSCKDCRFALSLLDALVASTMQVDVPTACYERTGKAIAVSVEAVSVANAPASAEQWQCRSVLLKAAASGLTLVMLRDRSPATSNRTLDWPGLIVMSLGKELAVM